MYSKVICNSAQGKNANENDDGNNSSSENVRILTIVKMNLCYSRDIASSSAFSHAGLRNE